MKWIGQHIWGFISRFRNDVYLEDISEVTQDHVVSIDADGKLYKQDVAAGDITAVTITTDSGGGSAASDTSGSADFSLLGAEGVGITNSGTTITAVAVAGEIDHNSLANYDARNHYAWSTDVSGTATIHANNIPTLNQNTTGSSGSCTGQAATVATIAGLAPNTATTQATQGNITSCANLATVGTISTGVWQGTAIASAYLDADTAHLSTSRQCTYYMMVDDIDTTKIYIPLQTPDTETSVATNKQLRFLAPFAGKLLKVFLRANTNLSGNTLTWTLETRNTSLATSGTPTVVGTQSGAGCTNKTMTTYDFTTGLDSGDNIIDAGDTVQLAVQSDAATANSQFYITCLWEWDLS